MSKKGRNIYKRRDNRWEARVYYSGSRKYRAVYAKTYKEAVQKQDKLRLEMGITGAKDALFASVAGIWLEDKSYTVKKSTLFSYSTKLNKHILPYFSEICLSKLNEQMMTAFVSTKIAEGLSQKYISDMVIIIKSISASAYKKLGIPDKIRDYKNIRFAAKEPQMLSNSDRRSLQQHLLTQEDSISLGIFTDMFTGLRIGELCALKWSDIDLENRVIAVNKTVQRLPAEGRTKTEVRITAPKTSSSERLIPIPDFLAKRLKTYKQNDDCYILSGTDKVIEPRLLTYKFKQILANAGVSSVKFHSLRHEFASNCIQNNFDIKTLSEILGHSSPTVTLKVYLHSSLEQKRKCMNRLKMY